MKQEQVIELAEKAGFTVACHAPIIMVDTNNWISHMDRFAALVEQATLERAAQKCEEIGWFMGGSVGAIKCSEELRNLTKEST